MVNLYAQICIFLWIALLAYWVVNFFNQKKVKFTVREYHGLIVAAGVVIGILFLKYAPVSLAPYPAPLFDVMGILGVLFALCGVVLAVWARITLGGNWNARVVLKKGHTLIKTGPYALIRHPIYTGFLLLTVGLALSAGSLRFSLGILIIAVFELLAFLHKLSLEEKLMKEEFAKEYLAYMKETKMLVPYLF